MLIGFQNRAQMLIRTLELACFSLYGPTHTFRYYEAIMRMWDLVVTIRDQDCGPQKRAHYIDYLQCIQCHVVDMTLDAPKIKYALFCGSQ